MKKTLALLLAILLMLSSLLIACAQPQDDTADTTTATAETTPAPTTPDETTPADVEQPGESKGCGGVITLGIIACIIPAAVVVLKKKD